MSSKTQQLKKLNTELHALQTELAKVTTTNSYLDIVVKANQAHFEKSDSDNGVGKFYLELSISAPTCDIYIPLSIASGKKPAGFIYQIEGTGEAAISRAEVKWRGGGITEIQLGTLTYIRIPRNKTCLFTIQVSTKGQKRKTYSIVITRVNFKLQPSDTRYLHISNEIASDTVTFS